MSTIQLAVGAVNAKLLNASKRARLSVSTLLSYRVDGAEFSDSFKNHKWDGRSTFYSFKDDVFPAGFMHMVYNHLVQKGYSVQIVKKPLPEPLGAKNPVVDDFPDDPRYDYQPGTIDKLLKYGQMIAQVATGGGKSRIARLAYARIKRPTMFLTTRTVLFYQMRDTFEQDLGVKVGMMGDSEWSPTKGFNVAMVQTLSQYLEKLTYRSEIDRQYDLIAKKEQDQLVALKRKQSRRRKKLSPEATLKEFTDLKKEQEKTRPKDEDLVLAVKTKVDAHEKRRVKVEKILAQFELIIMEEAHEVSSNAFYDVMRACKKGFYRLALTGTPFMKGDEEANMRLMASSGPIGIKVSERKLIDLGILAKPYFKFESVNNPGNIRRLDVYSRAYKIGIVKNIKRNARIGFEALRAARMGLSVLILVQRKDHGVILKKLINKAAGPGHAEFIYGDHNQKKRKAALDALGNGKPPVLIGTNILDVGVDVPSVGMGILAGGGKAEYTLRQRIGRTLRAKKKGPNVAFIIDFTDQHNTYLSDHAKARRFVVENIDGFSQGILAPGADFAELEEWKAIENGAL